MEKYENTAAVIAENLIYYRKMAGLTQQELASKINYSDKSISKWERGEGVPDVLVLAELANLYKLSINDFLSKNKKQRIGNAYFSKVLITILAITVAWVIATLSFFVIEMIGLSETSWFKPWFCFIYAIPVSAIVLIVFMDVFFKRFYNIISTAILIWSLALSIYLSLNMFDRMNMVFVLAIPVQVFMILFYILLLKKRKGE